MAVGLRYSLQNATDFWTLPKLGKHCCEALSLRTAFMVPVTVWLA
ncbi:Uncharacterised protein [Vibrio cholerae]|nr:Uncharacterised protein [Vibrio cholerae]CSH89088.1 Uncharacterised protein [Vibrio cholerae]